MNPRAVFLSLWPVKPRASCRVRDGLIVTGWLVLAGLCLAIDLPVARAAHEELVPSDLRALFHRAEVFGHAYGALAIVVTMHLLDPPRRRHLVHVVASFVAAGLTCDAIKLQIWRMRPRSYLEAELGGSTFVGSMWTNLWADRRVELGWLLETSHHSFPSAHTASAVALAVSLGRLYPAGRRWFFLLAALCALNRIDGGAHFASDVCVGAALGYLIVVSLPSAERMSDWIASRPVPSGRWRAVGGDGRRAIGDEAPCFVRQLRAKMGYMRRPATTRLGPQRRA